MGKSQQKESSVLRWKQERIDFRLSPRLLVNYPTKQVCMSNVKSYKTHPSYCLSFRSMHPDTASKAEDEGVLRRISGDRVGNSSQRGSDGRTTVRRQQD